MWRRSNRGWSLVELAVVIAGVGVLVALLWPLIQRLLPASRDAAADPRTLQVQQAIEGFAAVHLRLPTPLEATNSPTRPGFVEGWLPASLLGLPETPRTRYFANKTLTEAPATVLVADPAQLASGAIKPRTDFNGLDFCYAALLQDRSGPVTPAGHRASYAVQTAHTMQGSPAEQVPLWLPDEGVAAPVDRQLETTAVGHLEMLGRLGCVDRLTRLSNSVKQAATQQDLLKLAKVAVDYENLNVKSAEEGIVNLKWREANWSVGLTALGVGEALAITQLAIAKDIAIETVPAIIANHASMTLAIAGGSVFLYQTVTALRASEKSYPLVVAARDDAVAYQADVQGLADESVQRVQQWQTKGLKP